MKDDTQVLSHVSGLTDENGVTDHGVERGHRIRTRKIGDRWAFSIDEGPFQAGDWKDQHATEIVARETVRHHRLDATGE